MPKYVVTDNVTGQQFIVDAPEGASAEDALGYFKQQHRATEAAAEEQPVELPTFDYEKELAAISALAPVERGFFGNIKAGAKRATQELGNLAWNELPALVESGLGFDERALENLKAAQARREEIEKETPTQYKSLEDIKGAGDVLPYFGERLGEQLSNLATMVGTGGAASILARRAVEKAAEKKLAGLAEQRLGAAAEREATKRSAAAEGLKPEFAAALPEEQLAAARAAVPAEAVGKAAASMAQRLTPGAQLAAAEKGALAGAALGAYATTAPAMFQNLYEETGEVAPGAAAIFGAIDAGLNTVLPYKLSKPVRTAVALKLLEKSGMEPSVLKSVGKTALKESGINVATESASAAINQIAEKVVDENENTWNSDDWKAVVEGGVNGLILGAPFGAYMGMQEGRGVKREFQAAREAEETVRRKAEADAAAEQARQAKFAAEQEEVKQLPTQISELEAQIQAFQPTIEAEPTKENQFKLKGLELQYDKLVDRFDYLSKTPEERVAIDEERRAAAATAAAPKPPKQIKVEDFTPSHFFDEIGVPVEKIKQFIKGANEGKKDADKIGVPFTEKAVGPNAAKLVDVLKAFDPRAVGMSEEEGLAAVKQIDRVLTTHPNLQPEAIKTSTIQGLKEDGFKAYYKQLLGSRDTGVLPETDLAIFNDLGVAIEDVKPSNPKLAEYLTIQQDTLAKKIEKANKPPKPQKLAPPQPTGPFTKEYLGSYGLAAPNNPIRKILFNRDIPTPEAADAVINDLKGLNVFTDKSRYSGAVLKVIGDQPILQEAFDRAFPKEPPITAGVKVPIESRARAAWDAYKTKTGILYDQLDDESKSFIHDELGDSDTLTPAAVEKLNRPGLLQRKVEEPVVEPVDVETAPTVEPTVESTVAEMPPTEAPVRNRVQAAWDEYLPETGIEYKHLDRETKNIVRDILRDRDFFHPDDVQGIVKNIDPAAIERERALERDKASRGVSQEELDTLKKGRKYVAEGEEKGLRELEGEKGEEGTLGSYIPADYSPRRARPSSEEAAEVEAGIRDKTPAQIAEFIAAKAPQLTYRIIARAISRTLQNLEAKSFTYNLEVSTRDASMRGGVTPSTRTFYINKDEGLSYTNVLHELVHSATHTLLDAKKLGPKHKALLDNYKAVYHYASEKWTRTVLAAMADKPHPDTGLEFTKAEKEFYESYGVRYGFTNIHEFTAMALTSPRFQEFLESIPYKDDAKRSLFSEFVSSIRRLLGIPAKADTALSEVLRSTEGLLKAGETVSERTLRALNESAPDVRKFANEIASAEEAPRALEPTPERKEFVPRIQHFERKPVSEAIVEAMSPQERVETSTTLATNTEKIRSAIFKRIDALVDEIPVWAGQDFARWFANKIETLTEAARDFALRFTSLRQLADIARQVNPRLADGIEKLSTRVAERNAAMDRYREQIEKFIDTSRKILGKYGRPVQDKFNRLVRETTMEQTPMDATPEQIDAMRTAGKYDTYMRLKAEFDSLPEDVRNKVYFPLHQLYKDMGGRFKSLIMEVADKVGALGTGNKILLQMMKREINPYFPLYRKGDYWLRFIDKDGQENVMAFETPSERRAARKGLVEDGLVGSDKDMIDFSRLNELNLDSLPPTSQFRQVLKVLKEANVDEAVQEEVFRNYLDLFPTNSVMQQFRHRRNVRGSREDALSALADVGTRIAMNVVQFDHVNRIDEALQEAKGSIPRTDTRIIEKAISDNLEKRMKYIKSPIQKGTFNQFAAWAGYNSYRYFLLGNISSAIVNLTQLPIVTYSILGGRYGGAQAMTAMRDAMKLYMKGGWDNNTTMVLPFTDKVMSDRTFFRPDINKDALKQLGVTQDQLTQLYLRAVNEGAIRRSTGQDLMEMRQRGVRDVAGGETAVDKVANMYQRVEYGLGWVFQNSERFNREVTLLAAYNLEYKRLKKNLSDEAAHEGAIRGAIRTVEDANGSAMTETGPEIFQTGIGRLVGTFKRFALAQIYLASKLFLKAFGPGSGVSKEERKIAQKQFGYIMGTAFAFSGIKGMPFFGGINMLSSLLMGEEGDETNLEEYLLGNSDVITRGPMSAFTGVDIASRVGFTDLVWRDDPKRLAEVGLPTYVIELLGGPAVGIAKNMVRAAEYFDQGQYERGLEAALPAAIRNGMKAIRFATQGATTKEGAPLMDDVSGYNMLMQLAGFTPNELALTYAQNEIEKRTKREGDQYRTALLERLNIAKDLGDQDGIDDAQEAIDKFNATKYGQVKPIKQETINKSAISHRKRLDQMSQTHGVYLGKPGSAEVQYLQEKSGRQ